MAVYIFTVRPFEKREDNIINAFNELVLVFIFASTAVINKCDLSESAVSVWGWIFILLLASSLLLTWIIILPNTFKELKKSITNFFKKKEKSKNPDKGEIKSKEMEIEFTAYKSNNVEPLNAERFKTS